jgi:membrane fusion protein, copper/silver efflux system
MFTNHKFRKMCAGAGALMVAATISGCAVSLPPAPRNDPANPHASQAATRPLRPSLLATSRSFLSPAADDREEKAKKMDMKKMEETGSPASAAAYYTCPMHSQIKEAKPGNCPICGMTLIKKSAEREGAKR